MSHDTPRPPHVTDRAAVVSAQLAPLAQGVAALLPRTNEIADAITDHLLDAEQVWYGGAGDEIHADLRASTRAHVRGGIERLAGDPEATRRAVDLWRETGRRRAQQGIPVAAVLYAYNIGTRILWEALLESGQELGISATDLLHAGQMLWGDLDAQCQILRESYRREELVLHHEDPARSAEVLEGLLRGRGSDPQVAADARAVLGLTVEAELVCLVWLPEEPIPSVALARERLQNAGFRAHWSLHGEYAVGIVSAASGDRPRMRQVMARSVRGRVGTAACRDGLAGIVTAHHHALAAAGTLAPGSGGVVDIADRLPEALVAGSPDLTAMLVEETLQPLLGLTGATRTALLDTLVAAVRRGGSVTAAAEDLVCHRNTVLYRMKRIEQLTERSFDDPRDRLLLTLAVIAIREDLGFESGRTAP